MKKTVILSFTLSGHGFSGAVCIDGDIKYASSLERITRVKKHNAKAKRTYRIIGIE